MKLEINLRYLKQRMGLFVWKVVAFKSFDGELFQITFSEGGD